MAHDLFNPFASGFGLGIAGIDRSHDLSGGTPDPSFEALIPRGPVRQFVSFSVGGGEYAVDILSIREFKRWCEATKLPNTPEYVRGVINLRGVVVPVYDLRARFGLGATDVSTMHVIMMVAAKGRTVGLLVDAVDDVLTLPLDAVSDVPEVDSSGANHPYVDGMVTVNGRMVAVLGLERLFANEAIPVVAP